MASDYQYATEAEVEEQFDLLTKVYTDDNALDPFISKAEKHINMRLKAKYSVPFTAGSPPDMVHELTIDLAAFYAFRSHFTRDNKNEAKWLKGIWDSVKEQLDRIVDDEEALVNADGSEPGGNDDQVYSDTMDYNSTFNVDDPLSQAQDADKLDDIDDERDS